MFGDLCEKLWHASAKARLGRSNAVFNYSGEDNATECPVNKRELDRLKA